MILLDRVSWYDFRRCRPDTEYQIDPLDGRGLNISHPYGEEHQEKARDHQAERPCGDPPDQGATG